MNIDATALEEILSSCGDLLTESQEEALKAAIASADNSSRDVVDEVLPALPEDYGILRTEGHSGSSVSERGYTSEQMRDYARAALQATALPAVTAFDMLAHLQRQREWSGHTFGPGPRTAGVIDHIRKELREIEADPTDLSEWIDVVILALDGAWRAGGTPEQIIATLVAKQTKNEGRTWPDWRTAAPDKAIEHDRTQDALPAAKSEFMGWVHEVTWIDGTSRRLHQKEPTPLDDTSGLTSQRIVRVFTQPAVPEMPKDAPLTATALAEALSCFWNAAIGSQSVQYDPTARAVAGAMAEGLAAVECRLRELAATPKDQPAQGGVVMPFWWTREGYEPLCNRCGDANDIGHELGAFTDAFGDGPSCPDCNGKNRARFDAWFKQRKGTSHE